MGSFDAFFDDEPGYRIRRQEFELPAIDLDAEEASVVGVAARVWQHASMAESTMSALAKLRAAGIEPDPSQLAALEPSVQATEPAFDPLWSAVLDRARVSFTYRDGDQRTLEPWGLTASKGRWYVIGWDIDRAGRPGCSSCRGSPTSPAGLPGGRVRGAGRPRPAGAGPLARPGRADQGGPAGHPHRPGSGPGPPRRAACDRQTELPGGFEVFAVAYGDLWSLAEEIRQHGADVVVLEPAELRDAVIRGLRPSWRRPGRVTASDGRRGGPPRRLRCVGC